MFRIRPGLTFCPRWYYFNIRCVVELQAVHRNSDAARCYFWDIWDKQVGGQWTYFAPSFQCMVYILGCIANTEVNIVNIVINGQVVKQSNCDAILRV